jgi:von Willebrand factor type A domain
MPPLYRMPIFYLTLAIALIVWRAATRTPTRTPIADVATPATLPPPPLIESDPSDPFLRTPEGLRRKALIRSLGVIPRLAPDKPQESGPALGYYSIVLIAAEQPDWLKVGRSDGTIWGWIPAESALEWDTRLMARAIVGPDRPPLTLFRERSCLLDFLAHRTCAVHERDCPIEGELAVATTPNPEPPLGLPILNSESIPQPDGKARTILEVASLVEDRAPPPPPPARPPDALARLLRRLDVAFVIDSTASMQTSIEACKRLADDLVGRSDSADITLRLALVEFRDASPTFGFKTRIASDFVGAAAFRAALDRVSAASQGDGSVDEAVLDGVLAALPRSPSDPLGQRLSWPTGREGELATKLIILIGDAPDHDTTLDRARTLADRAKQAGIMIATVAINRPGALSRDESKRYAEQWTTLAEGSFRPLDRASGFATPVPPVKTTLSGVDRLRESLDAIIADRTEAARNLASLALAEAEGRLRQYVTSQGMTLDRVAPVLVDLHRGEELPSARPDPRQEGFKAPSVRRGWISRDAASVEILMSRDEVDLLIEEFTRLQQALHSGAGDLNEFLRIGTAAATGETSFLAADRGRLTFTEHLARRRGLPTLASDDLLAQTQSDLLRADEPTRAALDRLLSSAISRLVARRNDSDWNDPTRTVDGMAGVDL